MKVRYRKKEILESKKPSLQSNRSCRDRRAWESDPLPDQSHPGSCPRAPEEKSGRGFSQLQGVLDIRRVR